jgi:hypothetical protein
VEWEMAGVERVETFSFSTESETEGAFPAPLVRQVRVVCRRIVRRHSSALFVKLFLLSS